MIRKFKSLIHTFLIIKAIELEISNDGISELEEDQRPKTSPPNAKKATVNSPVQKSPNLNSSPKNGKKDTSNLPPQKRPFEELKKTMILQQPSPKQRPTKSKVKRRTLDFSSNNRKITDFFGLCSPPSC